jgi:protein arginine kinase activator
MICDICKKHDAKVHLTTIVDGKMLKMDLCEACAKAKGVQEETVFSPSDLMVGLGSAEEIKADAPGVRCPACGFSQADFKKTGRLGCAVCWETFESGMAGLLKAMHKSDRHVGKVPSKAAHTVALSEQIKNLLAELDKAVHDEQYEQAARLRDQIRALETRLKVVPSQS